MAKFYALTHIVGLTHTEMEPGKVYDLDPSRPDVLALVATKYGGTESKADYASLIPEAEYTKLKLAGLAVCSKCQSLLSQDERNAYVAANAAPVAA